MSRNAEVLFGVFLLIVGIVLKKLIVCGVGFYHLAIYFQFDDDTKHAITIAPFGTSGCFSSGQSDDVIVIPQTAGRAVGTSSTTAYTTTFGGRGGMGPVFQND